MQVGAVSQAGISSSQTSQGDASAVPAQAGAVTEDVQASRPKPPAVNPSLQVRNADGQVFLVVRDANGEVEYKIPSEYILRIYGQPLKEASEKLSQIKQPEPKAKEEAEAAAAAAAATKRSSEASGPKESGNASTAPAPTPTNTFA